MTKVAEKKKYATVTPENLPATKTVDLDEYVNITARLGISMEVALNVLVANLFGFDQEKIDERRPRSS